MKRSQRKKQQKAERQAKAKDPSKKSGFRKLTVEGATYQYKVGDKYTELRPPGKIDLKWVIPNWRLTGFTSLAEWKLAWAAHPNCDDPDCDYDCCMKHNTLIAVTPGLIRHYIDEMRKVTCAR